MSIPDIVSAILAPIFGYLIDWQISSAAAVAAEKEQDEKSLIIDGSSSHSSLQSSSSSTNSHFSSNTVDPLLKASKSDSSKKANNRAAWLIGRWMPLAGLGLTLVHVCFAFIPAESLSAPPILICLGISYSLLTSVLWPIIPWLVPQKHSGTAYGISSVSLNVSLSLFPILVSYIFDRGNFPAVEIFFVFTAASGLFLSVFFVRSRWLEHQKSNLQKYQ